MGLVSNILSYFGPAPIPGANVRSSEAEAALTVRTDAPVGLTPRAGGYLYTLNSPAMAIATVFRCVHVLANSVAQTPIRHLVKRGGRFVEADDALQRLLTVEADNCVGAYEFWQSIIYDILLKGNAYAVPIFNPNTLTYSRLAICRDSVSYDVTTQLYHVKDYQSGISGVYEAADILHFKGAGADPYTGQSVLSFARQSLDIAAAGDKETLKRFATGGELRGFVTNDTGRGNPYGKNRDSELGSVANQIQVLHSQGYNIFSLPGDAKFQGLSLSSTDMQFLESRKFTVRELCRFFGVPPEFAFDDTNKVYGSAQAADLSYFSKSLNPILRKIENELNRKLIPRSLAGKERIEFDRRHFFNADQADYFAKMIAAGVMTVNEAREMINQPPIDGGDNPLISANLKTINELLTSND